MIVWSDEFKFNAFGSNEKQYVRRPPNKQWNPKHTKQIVKHGDASIIVCGKDLRDYERRNIQ